LRSRWSAARATLRSLLPRYGVDARARFVTSDAGKPKVSGDAVRFSVSHSEDRAVFAFSNDLDVGVDCELAPRLDDTVGLSRRFLSEGEARDVEASVLEKRRDFFLSLWTAKEATLKALGTGIADHLDRFTLRRTDDGRFAIVESRLAILNAATATVVDLAARTGFAAALAAIGDARAWRFLDLSTNGRRARGAEARG
jgi:4'-phosphopantetheinyl transferase